MADLGALKVRIEADSSGLEKGMSKAQQTVKRGGAQLRTSVGQWAKWGAAAAGAMAVAGAAIFKATSESIRQLKIMSQVANTNVADFQRMAYGAQQFGIEQDKLSDILKDVNDRVGDFIATGAGPMADFFENIAPKVGVTAQQFQKLNGKDALQLYVSSLEKANLSQSEMTFYMEAIAGDATRLLPLLRDNGAAMQSFADEADRLGIVLSEIDIAKVEQANQAMRRVSAYGSGIAQQFTVELAPVVTAIAEHFADVAEEAGGMNKVIRTGLDGIATAVGVVADAYRGWEAIFAALRVAGGAFSSALIRILKAPLDAIQLVINGSIDGLNKMIKAANVISPVEFELITPYQLSSLGTMNDLLRSSRIVTKGFKNDLDELTNLPLPSDVIAKRLEEARAKAAEAAATTSGTEIQGGGGSFGGEETGGMDKSAEQIRDKTEDMLKAYDERFMSQRELEQQHFESEIEMLALAMEQELLTKEQFQDRIEQSTQAHKDRLLAMDEAEKNAKLSMASSMFSGLANLMNTNSKKLFKIGKAAAIAGAVVDAYKGISKTLAEYPYPWNLGFAAAHAATAFAQIQNIKKQQFGAAGSPSTFVDGQPAVRTTGSGGGGGTTGGSSGGQNININLVGDNFSGSGVRGLIGEINKALGDGVQLNV